MQSIETLLINEPLIKQLTDQLLHVSGTSLTSPKLNMYVNYNTLKYLEDFRDLLRDSTSLVSTVELEYFKLNSPPDTRNHMVMELGCNQPTYFTGINTISYP